MDLQKLVNAMNDMGRRERANYHVTLGRLIKDLEGCAPDGRVRFDDTGTPGDVDSYRGYYSDLAFEPSEREITVSEFLAECKETLGQTFTGYKGGDFYMGDDTPLWRSDWGRCTDEAIVRTSVAEDDGGLILHIKSLYPDG